MYMFYCTYRQLYIIDKMHMIQHVSLAIITCTDMYIMTCSIHIYHISHNSVTQVCSLSNYYSLQILSEINPYFIFDTLRWIDQHDQNLCNIFQNRSLIPDSANWPLLCLCTLLIASRDQGNYKSLARQVRTTGQLTQPQTLPWSRCHGYGNIRHVRAVNQIQTKSK